jgi:DNA polymerase III subunit alpha
MKPEDFVHLHVHSHYSTLDGAATVGGLMKKARSCGMKALALTDHGTISGVLEFYNAGTKNDAAVKPILGMEAYLAEGSRFEKQIDDRPARTYHLTLLARNNTGYRNLIKLSSAGHVEGFYRKPRIDLEILDRYSEGLIALSGCLSGRIARALTFEKPGTADELASTFRDILGDGNYYIEVMKNGLEAQEKVNVQLIELARRLDLPLVATNDIHYLTQENSLVQEVLVCVQRGQTLTDEKRQRMDSDEFYFKSGEEMIRQFSDLPEAVENTALIAERCNVELKFGTYHIPEFRTEKGERPEEMLRRLCGIGIAERYGTPGQPVLDRLDRELGVINEMGFASYFLIVWDFIRYARENEIPVGPGRGSAAGSVVAYSLGITQLDPLKYDLIFERFLNSARISMPDIDIDFCIKGREKVVNYVREKYGRENVCQIVTFGTLGAKAALRDAGRVLDIDLPTVDSAAKKIPLVKPPGAAGTLLEIALREDKDLKEMANRNPAIRNWFDISLKIEGLNRHTSTHAAGVVITDKPLTEYVPLCRVKDEINTQFQMGELDDIGLLKMDFLGLKNLTVIDKALDLIAENQGTRIDLATLPLDDEKTYSLLRSGKAKGLFQLESSDGMSELLVKLKPDCFEDIIALLALYRPGPLRSGMVDLYVERKHGRQEVEMLHDDLTDILTETYGVIVYQEQVMRIANVLSGFSLNDADMLRKAMGKKKPEVMQKFRREFVDGAVARGVNKKDAGDIFDKIEFFAGYGFNKSHSAAYALITYTTAYLKANYTVEYMSALMSCDSGNSDKIADYVEECERMQFKVLGPDYNDSKPDFSISGNDIRFGLNAIKGLGEKAAESIVEARGEAGGRVESISDMLERIDLKTFNKLGLETMIKAGAFDSSGINRASLFARAEQLLSAATTEQKDRRNGQASLFGGPKTDGQGASFIPICDDWDDDFKLICEKEALGFVLSINPLKQYAPLLLRLFPAGPKELQDCEEGTRVTLGGTLEQLRTTMARKGRYAGKKIALFRIRTLGGRVPAVLFSEEYEKSAHRLQEDKIIVFAGTVDRKREEPSLIVSEIHSLDEALKLRVSNIILFLGPAQNKEGAATSCDKPANSILEAILGVCRDHSGDLNLLLHYDGSKRQGFTIRADPRHGLALTLESIAALEELVGAENVELR